MKHLLRTAAITAVMSFAAVAAAQITESPVPPPGAAAPAQAFPSSTVAPPAMSATQPSPNQQSRPRRAVRQSHGRSTTHRYDPRDHVANQLNAQQLGQAAAQGAYAAAPGGPPQHGFPDFGAPSYGPPGNSTPAYPGMGGPGMGGPGMAGPRWAAPAWVAPTLCSQLAAATSDALCAGVQPGGGRIRQCMRARIREASPGCIEAVRASRATLG